MFENATTHAYVVNNKFYKIARQTTYACIESYETNTRILYT